MKVLLSLVLAFLITGGSVVAKASDSESSRKSLRGIAAIEVVVENPSKDALDLGLTEEKLQTDVELRLRKAQIKVGRPALPQTFPGIDWLETYVNAIATLYVRVSVMKHGDADFTPGCIRLPVHAIVIEVELYQPVQLLRDSNVKPLASTWSTTFWGFMSSERSIRESVADQVDEFINAYLSVNPK